MAESSVKGPGSQKGDGNSFLHLRESKASNRWPKHQSKDQARNKEMTNHPCISEKAMLATYGRHIRQRPRLATMRWSILLEAQREQGLQQMTETSVKGPGSQHGCGETFLHLKKRLRPVAQTSIKGPGSQQGDGKSCLHLKEKKDCNGWPKHPSKDQPRNTEMVNYSCISKRTRLATHGRHIRQMPRLATRRWYITLASQENKTYIQQMAETPVKGPSSQTRDGKSFLHLRQQGLQQVAATSKDQARNKEMANYPCISE